MTIDIMYCTSSGNIYADSYVDGIVGMLYSCEINKDLLDTNTVTGKIGKPGDNTWNADGTSVGPPVKLPAGN